MAELESHPSRSPGTSPTRAGNFRTPTLTESPAGLRAWLGAEGHPLLFAEDKCAFTRISLGVSGLTRRQKLSRLFVGRPSRLHGENQ